MKKYRIIAGASAAVLALGLMTGCSQKQEEVVEEEPIVQEEIQEDTTLESVPEEELVVEFPLEEEEPSEESEEESVEDPEDELPAEELTIQVAEITEIAEDGSLMALPYALADETAEHIIEDYANVDFSAYVAGEEAEALILSEDALFQVALDGELSDADAESLMVGSMVVVTTAADGSQTVVIYNPVAEEAA